MKKEQGYVTYKRNFDRYKINAKRMGRTFRLTKEEFVDIVSLNCYYCNAKPKISNMYLDATGKRKHEHKDRLQVTVDRATAKMNGIDRANNNLGYEKDNCLPCCYICNFLKKDYSISEFLKIIKKFIRTNT